jgi:outer membrane protein OmpA-like peptidoglycan-associated protein
MKKVILSEKQIKRLMDKLIINEQETENNQQNQGNVPDTGYKVYFIDTTAYAVKTNGKNDFQLFKLQTNGNGGNEYHITKELATKPVITMLENGWTDLRKNNEEFESNSTYTPQIKFDPKDPKTYNGVQVQRGTDKDGNIIWGERKEKITYQKILDEKTENSFDEALYKPWPVKQSEFIPYSITRGIKCVILGNSYPENDVPVFGTLFLMFDRRLPRNYKLKVLTDEPGNQIILGETAVKKKEGYHWLHFEGSWKGSGGHPWDPNEKGTPETPNETPKIDPIVLTFEKGLNDAFNFDQTTLNDEGNKNLQDLINYTNENYQGVSAKIPVICSASIDGDPNQKLKNGMTRSQYNMDLSKRRADAIATILSNQINVDTFEFLPQGIGETDKFDPGKKWPEVTDKLQTAGNRKLIIQLPKLQKTIQQK